MAIAPSLAGSIRCTVDGLTVEETVEEAVLPALSASAVFVLVVEVKIADAVDVSLLILTRWHFLPPNSFCASCVVGPSVGALGVLGVLTTLTLVVVLTTEMLELVVVKMGVGEACELGVGEAANVAAANSSVVDGSSGGGGGGGGGGGRLG